MKSSKKTFKNHFVKRDPRTQRLMAKDGTPVVGDFIRTTRITPQMAEGLNLNWESSGRMWVEEKEEKPKKEKPKKELTDVEKEKLANKEKRKELMEVAEQLVKDGKLEKMPPINIPLEKLESKLNELKTD